MKTSTLIVVRALLLLAGVVASALSHAQALGVVMMHGKWATPPHWHQPVSREIESQGWLVTELTMPWAGHRMYDAGYDVALAQVAEAVRALRAKGVKRVVVGGHSFGANAALAYVAGGGDADGMLAMAPGHSPRYSYYLGHTKGVVEEARTLVAAGQGSQRVSFTDLNQNVTRTLSMRADIFLSYFDPEGAGDMPTSAARITRPTPLLWLIGTQDPLYRLGAAFAFDKVPAHPLNRYVVVAADHANTPNAGSAQIIDWLKAVAAQP